MKILWFVTLPFMYNIIYGIAGNETEKSLKTIKLEENQDESNYETDRTRTSPKSEKFNFHFIPRKKRCTIQRKVPEYLNTFQIRVKNELPKLTNAKTTYSVPSSSKKNNNDVMQNHCVECNVSFRYDTHYAKHCKDEHGINRPFPCGYCKLMFAVKRCLVEHMDKVHGLKKHTFTRWKKYEPIVCDECQEILPGWMKFEQHALSRHEGIKVMCCSQCPKKFLRRKHLLRHEKADHRNLEMMCDICKNIFERSDLLEEHLEFCQKRQIQNKMGDNQMDTIIRYEMLVCEECGDEHKTRTLLRDHLRLKHPHVKLHPCDHCDAAFSSSGSLEKHVGMLHPDKICEINTWKKFKRRAIYTCDHCKENFTGTLAYEKHGKVHPGLPMFRCKDCGRGYGTRNSLKNHANEVHGDVKTRCSYCSKCYFHIWNHEKDCRKKIEERERKRMAGYPKYYCNICSQDFYMKHHSFKNHVSRHKYYEFCAICGQRFRRGKGALNEHMERKHPLRENIEALLRTADEVRTFAKSEKTMNEQYTNPVTECFDMRKNSREVKAKAPEIYVKLEENNSKEPK